ncbi:hypothetical protein IEO21_04159 [Rhodonia placenta]|uniref:Uncharacterized protein n=1 Tax=Rhodonia placenta TaxID=104341 RepID=A0A8H7P4A2_9APHY|nr:hypothetical protein IEO21_04159 [Postia placenta]
MQEAPTQRSSWSSWYTNGPPSHAKSHGRYGTPPKTLISAITEASTRVVCSQTVTREVGSSKVGGDMMMVGNTQIDLAVGGGTKPIVLRTPTTPTRKTCLWMKIICRAYPTHLGRCFAISALHQRHWGGMKVKAISLIEVRLRHYCEQSG